MRPRARPEHVQDDSSGEEPLLPHAAARLTLYTAAERTRAKLAERYLRVWQPLDVPVSLLLDDKPGYVLKALPETVRPVLAVTPNRSAHYLLDVLEHQPEGLIVSPSLPSVLGPYLLRVANGERFYEGPPPSKTPLTPREREVLRRTMYGESVEALAESLGIIPYTAGEHLRHIREKLGVERNAELVLAYFAGDTAQLAV